MALPALGKPGGTLEQIKKFCDDVYGLLTGHGLSGAESSIADSVNSLKSNQGGPENPQGEGNLSGWDPGDIKICAYAASEVDLKLWLPCDGRAVSRKTYTRLFKKIGTTFGVGDGSTTFNAPDLRGRAVIAPDNWGGTSANRVTAAWADSLGGVGGSEEPQAHRHLLFVQQVNVDSPGLTSANQTAWARSSVVSPDHSYGLDSGGASSEPTVGRSESVGAGTEKNVQPSIVLGALIKT